MHRNTHSDSHDRAVSPVIGVILMVAVTVILAAVVSMLVLGMGSDVESHPQASFSFDYDSGAGTVDITHEGGDTLDSDNVVIIHTNGTVSETAWSPANSDIDAGDYNSVAADSGTPVKVVWQGPNGDTAVLATYQVPS